jgi:hypothetical protein
MLSVLMSVLVGGIMSLRLRCLPVVLSPVPTRVPTLPSPPGSLHHIDTRGPVVHVVAHLAGSPLPDPRVSFKPLQYSEVSVRQALVDSHCLRLDGCHGIHGKQDSPYAVCVRAAVGVDMPAVEEAVLQYRRTLLQNQRFRSH